MSGTTRAGPTSSPPAPGELFRCHLADNLPAEEIPGE